jgi:hypothetical protein
MLLKDRSRTWRVDALIQALESDVANPDLQAYALHHFSNGRCAIVRVEDTGVLSRTASFLEVR